MESWSRRQERVVFRSDHFVGKGFYHADRPSSLWGVGRDGKGPQGQVILLVSAKKSRLVDHDYISGDGRNCNRRVLLRLGVLS